MKNNMIVFANAVLKDGKLMFFWTSGSECESVLDFYKDFYYAGLNMKEEIESGKYSLETKRMSQVGNAGFDEATEFYRQFELHEDYKGIKPY